MPLLFPSLLSGASASPFVVGFGVEFDCSFLSTGDGAEGLGVSEEDAWADLALVGCNFTSGS